MIEKKRPWRFAPREYTRSMEGASLLLQGAWMALKVSLWKEAKGAWKGSLAELSQGWGLQAEQVRGLLMEMVERKLLLVEEADGVIVLSIPMKEPRKRKARAPATPPAATPPPVATPPSTPLPPRVGMTVREITELLYPVTRYLSIEREHRLLIQVASFLSRRSPEELREAVRRLPPNWKPGELEAV